MGTSAKNIVFLVLVATLAIGLSLTVASARDHGGKFLNAKYFVAGGGSCLASAAPKLDGSPEPPPVILENDLFWVSNVAALSPDVMEGVYTFHPNGTGTFRGVTRIIVLLPGGTQGFGGSADSLWTFHYTVTETGEISFSHYGGSQTWTSGPNKGTIGPVTAGPLHGAISPDGQYLTVNCGPLPGPWDPDAPPILTNPDGSQLICVINLAGYLLEKYPFEERRH